MKRIDLTSEWIAGWAPRRQEEVVDKRSGLLLRGGPSGAKSFYYWSDVRDLATGAARRHRVRLGRWAIDGGGKTLSLGAARGAFDAIREAKQAAADGTAELTVGQLAEAYRRDVLARREPSSLAWSWGIIRTHVLPALPDPEGPPFGGWAARLVRPPDIAAVVRAAREERTVEVAREDGATVARRVGGPAVARAALRELKAMFATAVGAGALEMTPAGVLQAAALGLRGTKRGRYLDRDELAALFQVLDLNAILDGTAKDVRLEETTRLGIALLFYAPARSHSLVAARWEEVDLDGARWTIPPAKLKLHAEARAEARPFVVPLPATAVAILRRLHDLAGESPWVLASPKDTSFTNRFHMNCRIITKSFNFQICIGSLLLSADFVHGPNSMGGSRGVTFRSTSSAQSDSGGACSQGMG